MRLVTRQILSHLSLGFWRVNQKGARANNRNFSAFESMLDTKRAQAKSTIVVELSANKTAEFVSEALYICERHGPVAMATQYQIDRCRKSILLVEFKDIAAAYSVLDTCGFDSSEESLPIQSRILKLNPTVKPKLTNYKVNLEHYETPKKENIYNHIAQCQNISEQMQVLFESESLGDFESRLRFIVCAQIEDSLKGFFPHCQALPFGSSVNGFGRFDCDLDMFLNLCQKEHSKSVLMQFQSKDVNIQGRLKLQQSLHIMGDIFHNFLPNAVAVQRILHARVPIIKFQHNLLGLDCDLSMSNSTGLYMSELLYVYGNIDARLQPLVFAVRKWAAAAGVTNPVPGFWITNFSLSLMVIFFLQKTQPIVLPSLKKLKKLAGKEDARNAEGVNCTFLRNIEGINASENTSNLETLLIEFFHFYGSFDFKQDAISVQSGSTKPKPDNTALYIENPLEPNLNVSRNVTASELNKFKSELGLALLKLESGASPDINNGVWGILSLAGNIKLPPKQQHRTSRLSSTLQINQLFEKNERKVMTKGVAAATSRNNMASMSKNNMGAIVAPNKTLANRGNGKNDQKMRRNKENLWEVW